MIGAGRGRTRDARAPCRQRPSRGLPPPAPGRHAGRPDLANDVQDTVLTLKPRKADPEPRTVRIVRAPGSDWVLLTTLLDARTYPARDLADLYHQRWSIEELYKTVRQTLSMEAFHAQGLRGVQQELSAGLTLIALARLMSNDCETLVNGPGHLQRRGGLLANQKNALHAVYDGFEEMLPGFAQSCATFVSAAMARIADCMQRDRIHHSHHRVPRKPIGKWKPPKPARSQPEKPCRGHALS